MEGVKDAIHYLIAMLGYFGNCINNIYIYIYYLLKMGKPTSISADNLYVLIIRPILR
jgi:hypothetical protein